MNIDIPTQFSLFCPPLKFWNRKFKKWDSRFKYLHKSDRYVYKCTQSKNSENNHLNTTWLYNRERDNIPKGRVIYLFVTTHILDVSLVIFLYHYHAFYITKEPLHLSKTVMLKMPREDVEFPLFVRWESRSIYQINVKFYIMHRINM